MSSPVSQGVHWFHPGEVMIVARVANTATSPDQLHAAMQDLLRDRVQDLDTAPGSLRSFVFGAPGVETSLAFLFQKLSSATSAPDVKTTIEMLHEAALTMRTAAVEVLGVMPHWHTRAHELASGGSPGSHPVPVRRGEMPDDARRYRYQPTALDLAANDSAGSIPVAVFDTAIDVEYARDRARQLRNDYMRETLDHVASATGERNAREWTDVAQHHGERASSTYSMADHGLFVSGLIHGIAPSAPLTLTPVLDQYGVGDLSVLLAALRDLLDDKGPEKPQIINLSLGFRPHPAHLVAAWHGLDLPGSNPTYARAPEMFSPTQDWRWVSSNGALLRRRADLLLAGLDELSQYLSLNNCLLVAAAGNDSLAGEPRLHPRLPARSETVLGVAAMTADGKPASYSNIADEQRRGDHVSTFGGDRDQNCVPLDGVVGLYSGEFPPTARDRNPVNETGWGYWSGTSFATAIVTGLAANVWAANPTAHASDVLAQVHEAARKGRNFVTELRTYSIDVDGSWA